MSSAPTEPWPNKPPAALPGGAGGYYPMNLTIPAGGGLFADPTLLGGFGLEDGNGVTFIALTPDGNPLQAVGVIDGTTLTDGTIQVTTPGSGPTLYTVTDSVVTGSGAASIPFICVAFAFNFDDPGLTDGIVVPGWTPKGGDTILLVAIDKPAGAWDGTTPTAGLFVGSAATDGLMFADLTNEDEDEAGTNTAHSPDGNYFYYQATYVKADADEALIVVSQDGTKGGASPDSTTGTAILKINIYRPAP